MFEMNWEAYGMLLLVFILAVFISLGHSLLVWLVGYLRNWLRKKRDA